MSRPSRAVWQYQFILGLGGWPDGRILFTHMKLNARGLVAGLILGWLGSGPVHVYGATGTNAVCVATLSAADADEFAALVNARESHAEEAHVLARLLAEKRADVQTLADQLRRRFDVQPDRVYVYEPGSQTVYAVVSNAVAGIQTGRLERVVHKKLTSSEDVGTFTRLVTAKQLVEQLARALDILECEKQTAWERTDYELRSRFKLDAGRAYRLDVQTRRVFALPAQGSNVVAAARTPGTVK